MKPQKDLTGEMFHSWTVLCAAEKAGKHMRWLCKCSCGKEKVIYATHLVGGKSKSCSAGGNHGIGKKTPGHSSWVAMRARCGREKHPMYHRYGGRGIKVCPEWRESFLAFYRDMGERPDGMTLERIDGDGDYTPGNCTWASIKDQANNRCDNRYVEHDGVVLTIAQLADKLSLNYETLYSRIRRKEEIGEAGRL